MNDIAKRLDKLEKKLLVGQPRRSFKIPGFGTFDSLQEAANAPGWGDFVESRRQLVVRRLQRQRLNDNFILGAQNP